MVVEIKVILLEAEAVAVLLLLEEDVIHQQTENLAVLVLVSLQVLVVSANQVVVSDKLLEVVAEEQVNQAQVQVVVVV